MAQNLRKGDCKQKDWKVLGLIWCLSTSGSISRLWWGVCRLRLLVGAHMVDVVVVLPVTAVFVRPLQLRWENEVKFWFSLRFHPHLGLEGVVLLAEVLLPVVVRVAPPVAPLKGLVRWDVDVLEVVSPSKAAIGTRAGDGEGTSGARALWSGVA